MDPKNKTARKSIIKHLDVIQAQNLKFGCKELFIGMQVEALEQDKWYSSKIIEINNACHKVLVHFEGLDEGHDKWFHVLDEEIRPSSDARDPLFRLSQEQEKEDEVHQVAQDNKETFLSQCRDTAPGLSKKATMSPSEILQDHDYAKENLSLIQVQQKGLPKIMPWPSEIASRRGKKKKLFSDLTFSMEGRFKLLRPDDIVRIIRLCGGKYVTYLKSKVNYVIIGEHPKKTRMKKILDYRTHIVSEKEFFEVVSELSPFKDMTKPSHITSRILSDQEIKLEPDPQLQIPDVSVNNANDFDKENSNTQRTRSPVLEANVPIGGLARIINMAIKSPAAATNDLNTEAKGHVSEGKGLYTEAKVHLVEAKGLNTEAKGFATEATCSSTQTEGPVVEAKDRTTEVKDFITKAQGSEANGPTTETYTAEEAMISSIDYSGRQEECFTINQPRNIESRKKNEEKESRKASSDTELEVLKEEMFGKNLKSSYDFMSPRRRQLEKEKSQRGGKVSLNVFSVKGRKHCLAGKIFSYEGESNDLRVPNMIRHFGGMCFQNMTRNVEYLVTGENPRRCKIVQAHERGIEVLSIPDLLDMIKNLPGRPFGSASQNQEASADQRQASSTIFSTRAPQIRPQTPKDIAQSTPAHAAVHEKNQEKGQGSSTIGSSKETQPLQESSMDIAPSIPICKNSIFSTKETIMQPKITVGIKSSPLITASAISSTKETSFHSRSPLIAPGPPILAATDGHLRKTANVAQSNTSGKASLSYPIEVASFQNYGVNIAELTSNESETLRKEGQRWEEGADNVRSSTTHSDVPNAVEIAKGLPIRRETVFISGAPGCLQEKTFLFAGEGAEDLRLPRLICFFGGDFKNNITSDEDILIIGRNPNREKIQRAEEKKAKMINVSELLHMIRTLPAYTPSSSNKLPPCTTVRRKPAAEAHEKGVTVLSKQEFVNLISTIPASKKMKTSEPEKKKKKRIPLACRKKPSLPQAGKNPPTFQQPREMREDKSQGQWQQILINQEPQPFHNQQQHVKIRTQQYLQNQQEEDHQKQQNQQSCPVQNHLQLAENQFNDVEKEHQQQQQDIQSQQQQHFEDYHQQKQFFTGISEEQQPQHFGGLQEKHQERYFNNDKEEQQQDPKQKQQHFEDLQEEHQEQNFEGIEEDQKNIQQQQQQQYFEDHQEKQRGKHFMDIEEEREQDIEQLQPYFEDLQEEQQEQHLMDIEERQQQDLKEQQKHFESLQEEQQEQNFDGIEEKQKQNHQLQQQHFEGIQEEQEEQHFEGIEEEQEQDRAQLQPHVKGQPLLEGLQEEQQEQNFDGIEEEKEQDLEQHQQQFESLLGEQQGQHFKGIEEEQEQDREQLQPRFRGQPHLEGLQGEQQDQHSKTLKEEKQQDLEQEQQHFKISHGEQQEQHFHGIEEEQGQFLQQQKQQDFEHPQEEQREQNILDIEEEQQQGLLQQPSQFVLGEQQGPNSEGIEEEQEQDLQHQQPNCDIHREEQQEHHFIGFEKEQNEEFEQQQPHFEGLQEEQLEQYVAEEQEQNLEYQQQHCHGFQGEQQEKHFKDYEEEQQQYLKQQQQQFEDLQEEQREGHFKDNQEEQQQQQQEPFEDNQGGPQQQYFTDIEKEQQQKQFADLQDDQQELLFRNFEGMQQQENFKVHQEKQWQKHSEDVGKEQPQQQKSFEGLQKQQEEQMFKDSQEEQQQSLQQLEQQRHFELTRQKERLCHDHQHKRCVNQREQQQRYEKLQNEKQMSQYVQTQQQQHLQSPQHQDQLSQQFQREQQQYFQGRQQQRKQLQEIVENQNQCVQTQQQQHFHRNQKQQQSYQKHQRENQQSQCIQNQRQQHYDNSQQRHEESRNIQNEQQQRSKNQQQPHLPIQNLQNSNFHPQKHFQNHLQQPRQYGLQQDFQNLPRGHLSFQQKQGRFPSKEIFQWHLPERQTHLEQQKQQQKLQIPLRLSQELKQHPIQQLQQHQRLEHIPFEKENDITSRLEFNFSNEVEQSFSFARERMLTSADAAFYGDRRRTFTTNIASPSIQTSCLECPENCGSIVERHQLKSHLENDCKNVETECHICKFKMLRKDLDDHLSRNMGRHLTILGNELSSMKHMNSKLVEENIVLKNSMRNLNERIFTLEEELQHKHPRFEQQGGAEHADSISQLSH